ncbi:hypothetical protein SDJN03_01782, partial [Cucurbita argyrosperma subsp. sororia]
MGRKFYFLWSITCSGEFKVGVITFNMMLHVNKSSVKLNITELAELIANEIEVNVSQVHVLNFTSGETDFFIRWAIFPADTVATFLIPRQW